MVRILDVELYRHTDDVFDGPAHGAPPVHVSFCRLWRKNDAPRPPRVCLASFNARFILAHQVRPRPTSSSFIGPGLPGPYPVLLPKNQLGQPGSIIILIQLGLMSSNHIYKCKVLKKVDT